MLQVTYKAIHTLIPYENNSRTHTDEQINQIAASIKEFGITNPILIDQEGGIIAGHGRVLALNKLGIDKTPCIELVDLTEAQRKAYVLADNQIALNAGWDLDLLKIELEGLNDLDFDLDILGFENDFLDNLLQDLGGGLTDEDAVPDAPETATTQPGDIWILGNHRLMCGDSTDTGAVMALMDGQKADQMVTDPPYNVEYVGKTKQELTIVNDSMTDEEFRDFLAAAFKAADNVMKAGAVFYIWHADSEGYNFRGACIDAGWKVRQCLVWDKNVMVMGRQDYHWKHEPCLYGWKGGAGHLWATDRKQTTVLQFDRPARSKEHPTMKPIALIEYQILNNTKGEDIVLDLFGGAGSTLIACEKNNRICYIMEIDPIYCDVIIQRWEEYTGNKAELLQETEVIANAR